MKKSVRAALVIVVVAAAGAGFVRGGFFSREDPNVIRLSGNIELTQVDMSFKMSGRLVTLHAEEGSQVSKERSSPGLIRPRPSVRSSANWPDSSRRGRNWRKVSPRCGSRRPTSKATCA